MAAARTNESGGASSGDAAAYRKQARGLLGSQDRSRRSRNRDARRAAAVAANPALEPQLADVSIFPASLDGLTKAAEPDTGAIPSRFQTARGAIDWAERPRPSTGHPTRHRPGQRPDDHRLPGRPALHALFTDAAGRPLWLGRTRRHATVAQFLTRTVRDRGCVPCGASVQRCEAHHVVPRNAPAKGRTDIDNLALSCGPCHRGRHQRNDTLDRRRESERLTYRSRPANSTARANTASSIFSVSLPVKVFCWLTW